MTDTSSQDALNASDVIVDSSLQEFLFAGCEVGPHAIGLLDEFLEWNVLLTRYFGPIFSVVFLSVHAQRTRIFGKLPAEYFLKYSSTIFLRF